ncbi:helix-turn-helix domain-containing protein [Bacillus sp. FJAT-29790]|uniref:helix-turn-helix domain-containing protein n=1 Tax=Bacillus sp. FJAT-29790 TaxID=1895002 RepID=UPI001C21B48A|nr:helix-turn-helix domain-containing protein [Bacillus sp. FJAT-29790]MBU8880620.1 helix-turn-helix domain-containing protein [Bacillus sp. FJAT-29790]
MSEWEAKDFYVQRNAFSIQIRKLFRCITSKMGSKGKQHNASLHNTYIGQLERGEKNATIESLLKITNALGITLEELFSNTQTGPKTNSLEITQIITLLEDRSSIDQRTILGLLELLIDWKGND